MAQLQKAWIFPKQGYVKINVHAVHYAEPLPNGNTSGIGIVIRNHAGYIVKMLSGPIPNLTERAAELWAMLGGLRSAFYENKRMIQLESDNDEAVREWEGHRWFVDRNHASVIHQLEQRKNDPNGICEVKVVDPERNGLARFLAADGAANRNRLVVFRRPFGRGLELWRWDMGLGPIGEPFQEVEEEEYYQRADVHVLERDEHEAALLVADATSGISI